MGKSKTALKDKTAKLEKHQSKIDETTTTVVQLKDAVAQLETEIKEIDSAQAEATAIRTKESDDNAVAIKDYSQSADAVTTAIGVLRSYYEGPSLLQAGSRAEQRARQPSFGGASTQAGQGIISILEVAESDFNRLLAETQEEEESAESAY